MLNKKEIIAVVVSSLIIAFSITLFETWKIFLYALLAIFSVIVLNILGKKIMSYHIDSEIEVNLWEIKRTGLFYFFNFLPFKATHPSRKLSRPFPAGAFFPIVSKIFLFPFNSLVWMASLVFEVKPKVHRAAKRYGLYSFSEMTEWHIGLIAAAGIVTNLIFALVGYLINFPEFSRINIYYAFWNILPLSDLDGNKIFFGSAILWTFLASVVLVGVFFALFVI